MKHAMYSVASKAYCTGTKGVLILLLLALTGCALPSPPPRARPSMTLAPAP